MLCYNRIIKRKAIREGETKMFKVVRETNKYRVTRLFESKIVRIVFVEDKENRELDRIKFIRCGNVYIPAERMVVYRYEDEQALEQIVNMYREQEVR